MALLANSKRFALVCAVAGLTGCSHQLPRLDVQSIDGALDDYSCPAEMPAGQRDRCLKSFKADTQAGRELRLLRAYVYLGATAQYGARRFAFYSDAPADDANQLMGSIASTVEGLTMLESERLDSPADNGELVNGVIFYKVDKTEVLLRMVATVDAATKPVVRGVTGMLILNSNVDRIKKGAKIVRDLGVDKLFASAFQAGMQNLPAVQERNVPYETARAQILARLNASCLALATLAKRTEHSCGKSVVAAGAAVKSSGVVP